MQVHSLTFGFDFHSVVPQGSKLGPNQDKLLLTLYFFTYGNLTVQQLVNIWQQYTS